MPLCWAIRGTTPSAILDTNLVRIQVRPPNPPKPLTCRTIVLQDPDESAPTTSIGLNRTRVCPRSRLAVLLDSD